MAVPDEVGVRAVVADEVECLVLAAEEEGVAVLGSHQVTVLRSRNGRRNAAVDPGTLRLPSRQPVVKKAKDI